MFYQVKIIRKNTKPPVWRRAMIPSGITFAQLAVILEEMLEHPFTDAFEFESFARKERVAERHGEKTMLRDISYSFFNAPDTCVDAWMQPGRAFAFRPNRRIKSLPEYRLEVEKAVESYRYEYQGEMLDADCPVVCKQVTYYEDPYWSELEIVNRSLKEKYFLHEEKCTYPSVKEVRRLLKQKKGISIDSVCESRDVCNEKSGMELINHLEELMEKFHNQQQKILSIAESNSSGKSSTEMMERLLAAYDDEDLLFFEEDLGMQLQGKPVEVMRREIAEKLLEPEVMKTRLLTVTEEELDYFEKIMMEDAYFPTEQERKLLDSIYVCDYVCYYRNDSVEAIPEAVSVYIKLCEDGYRRYHSQARWLMKCLELAHCIYIAEPIKVVYQMYQKNSEVSCDYPEFLSLLKSLPDTLLKGVIKDDRLIYEQAYKGNAYKSLDSVRRKIDFAIPEKEEIEAFGKDLYPSTEPAYRRLYHFLEKGLGCEKDLCTYLCIQASRMFSAAGDIRRFIELLNELDVQFESEKQLPMFTNIMMDINNYTRKAELNGHRPTDLQPHAAAITRAAHQMNTGRRILSNEPCPCGSGKKYKRCCGRKNNPRFS